MLGSFILLVLWLAGLIETAIMQFGGSGTVNNACQAYVISQPYYGVQITTLAYLEQLSICK